jgi:hypothetical protein
MRSCGSASSETRSSPEAGPARHGARTSCCICSMAPSWRPAGRLPAALGIGRKRSRWDSELIVCCARRHGLLASTRPCLLDRRRVANAGPRLCRSRRGPAVSRSPGAGVLQLLTGGTDCQRDRGCCSPRQRGRDPIDGAFCTVFRIVQRANAHRATGPLTALAAVRGAGKRRLGSLPQSWRTSPLRSTTRRQCRNSSISLVPEPSPAAIAFARRGTIAQTFHLAPKRLRAPEPPAPCLCPQQQSARRSLAICFDRSRLAMPQACQCRSSEPVDAAADVRGEGWSSVATVPEDFRPRDDRRRGTLWLRDCRSASCRHGIRGE